MITALDSSVLIDVIEGSREFAASSLQAVKNAHLQGVAVLCDVAYAEICAAFDTRARCDSFLSDLSIQTEALSPESSFAASRSWLLYLRSGGKRSRILPDFLIAAHAIYQADALVTRDTGFYRTHFHQLRVIHPMKI